MQESELKAQDWPVCPMCTCGALVIGGGWAACPSCSFLKPTSELAPSRVLDFARVKIARKGGGETNIALFSRSGARFNRHVVDEIRVAVSQRLVHDGVWRKVRSSLVLGGAFTPMCVMNFHRNDHRFVTMPAGDAIQFAAVEKNAATHDVVSMMWISNSSPQTTGFQADNAAPVEAGANCFLNVHTHFYGAPTQVMSCSLRHDGRRFKLGSPEFHHVAVSSMIFQPVCWEVVRCIPGKIQPQMFSARIFSNGTCINASLCEDLDGPLSCSVAIRPPDSNTYNIIHLDASNVREARNLLDDKMSSMDEVMRGKNMPPDWAKTVSWDSDVSPRTIMMEIRKLDLWEHAGR